MQEQAGGAQSGEPGTPAGAGQTDQSQLRPPEATAPAGNFGCEEYSDDRGSELGHRWPRQETLALINIRTQMDDSFRAATLKAPLWDEVSRKLAELGYNRSGKKCKEKFENIHKYYKRTKDGRVSRQDGKSYRFYAQLDALHTHKPTTVPSMNPAASPTTISFATMQSSAPLAARIVPSLNPYSAPALTTVGVEGIQAMAREAGISFSSDSSFASSDSNEGSEDGEAGGRKRKRGDSVGRDGGVGSLPSSSSGMRKKMMALFEGLIKQITERQDAMHRRLLETVERREEQRVVQEETWRRIETARLSQERELLAKERAAAASRDATLISYLQRLTSEQPTPSPVAPEAQTPVATPTVKLAPLTPLPPAASETMQQSPPSPPPAVSQKQDQLQLTPHSLYDLAAYSEQQESGGGSLSFEPASSSSSRWPKTEVHALIQLRSELESRYQGAGSKGALWEEISDGMQRMGYSRNPKRCKEKWENINKYYKKAKERNKDRPEDSKTCPYFQQLDALYRQKYRGLSEIHDGESEKFSSKVASSPAEGRNTDV